jgi:hypothetical protein
MRLLFVATLLAVSSISAHAQTRLPSTATLGIAELPVRDAAIFQLTGGGIAVIRSADQNVTVIPASSGTDESGFAKLTFEVPDGKMIVITGVELPVMSTPITVWLSQLVGSADSELGWVVYDDFGTGDGTKNPAAKDKLSAPLVLAPGKTYQLHSSDIAAGITVRGFYLDEE